MTRTTFIAAIVGVVVSSSLATAYVLVSTDLAERIMPRPVLSQLEQCHKDAAELFDDTIATGLRDPEAKAATEILIMLRPTVLTMISKKDLDTCLYDLEDRKAMLEKARAKLTAKGL